MNDFSEPADSPALKWIGRILSLPPAALLTMSGVMKLMKPEMVTEGFAKMGYPDSAIVPLGAIELTATLLFLIPQTAILGAVVLTGYLGGATATHLQAGDPWAQVFTAPVIGAVIWLALVLRDYRMRQLMPIRWAADPDKRTSVFVPIFAVLGFVAIGLATYIAMQPDSMTITRSIKITAPPSVVYAQLNDFHKWQDWSPWAKLDPNMTSTYEGPEAGEGAIYKWVSNNQEVGEGKMTILESRPDEFLKLKLEFIKPMPATNTVEFTLNPEGEQTEVLWTMYGKSEFMFKAMGVVMNMDKMIGDDFEKGLAAIKSIAEGKPTEAVPTEKLPTETPPTETTPNPTEAVPTEVPPKE